MTQPKPIDLRITTFNADGSTCIALDDALRCGDCGQMHYIFVNRNGSTRCAACDAKKEGAVSDEHFNTSTLQHLDSSRGER